VFLSLAVFIAAQIYFAQVKQKLGLLEGPPGYRKRSGSKLRRRL
jgi:hypothetical protein